MKKIIPAILTVFMLLAFAGCSAAGPENSSSSASSQSKSLHEDSNPIAVYKKITAQEAKSIMEKQSDVIILDVRTESEFAESHIKGAVLIPDNEIASKAGKALPDKNQTILVYCRSGRRSALAAQELVKLGYTGVQDFGGIIDWPYETVK